MGFEPIVVCTLNTLRLPISPRELVLRINRNAQVRQPLSLTYFSCIEYFRRMTVLR